MFVLGTHFSADRGNKIPFKEAIEITEKAVDMSKVKEIILHEGSTKSTKTELYKTITGKDSFLAKALVQFYEAESDNTARVKYMYYTNKYQMAEIALEVDKDAETIEIAKKFQDMEPINVEVVYN